MTVTQTAGAVAAAPLSSLIPTLHFSGPARHTITQQLPLPNPSLKHWTWKARIDGEHWHGESSITVAPKQTTHYTLTFTSSASSHTKGQLSLRNRTTGDELTFNLTANTTEPLAEPPTTLTTQARTTTQHSLPVVNDTATLLEYKVESDLPSLTGAPTLRVPPQSTATYNFTCRPLLAGHFAASLTFSSYYDGRLLQRFFPLHLSVAPPLPSADVRLVCDAHSSVEAELEIDNPSQSDAVSFIVEVDGRYTSGDNTLTIPPASSQHYTLTFAPLQPGQYSGTVSFIHPVHGEYVYRLVLEATRPPPTELPAMKVELGGEGRVLVWVSNPMDEEVKCVGLAPLTPLPTTSFLSFISHSAERTINFRNPYTQPTAFTFTLSNPTNTAPFTLTAPLSTTPATTFTYTLPPLATLPVTVTFTPAIIQTYSDTLTVGVVSSSSLQWTYPLTGVGEGVILSDVIAVECRAKQVSELRRTIELPGAADATDSEQLSVAMEWDDNMPSSAAQQPAVTVTMNGIERNDATDGKTMLTVTFLFAPRKPLDVRCALVVIKADGGRWRCPVRLIATDAAMDDTIDCEASVGAATTVQFQLRNDMDRAASYRAYLSTSSSPAFKVAPKVGRLPPSSASVGCVLNVTFTPLDYRLEFDGLLLVETDTTLFSYALKGRLPAYKAPKQVKAKVDAGRIE